MSRHSGDAHVHQLRIARNGCPYLATLACYWQASLAARPSGDAEVGSIADERIETAGTVRQRVVSGLYFGMLRSGEHGGEPGRTRPSST